MRVYEVAKEKGVSSKKILDLLKKAGIELSSHMSVVPEKGIGYLKKEFEKEIKGVVSKKEAFEVTKRKEAIVKKEKAVKPVVVTKETKKITPKEGKVPLKSSQKIIEKKKTKVHTMFTRKSGRHIHSEKVITQISVEKNIPLFEAAELMGKTCGELILVLLKKGMVCNRNHVLSIDKISDLAEQFGIEVVKKEKEEVDVERKEIIDLKKTKEGVNRWPIVVVLGHVDHGKTTLLDFLRKMNTAAREKGGITQHLRAYEVDSSHGKIIFFDTPGHEAFSYMRLKGTRITDIAVLIVAADDGVKPQTIESIKHAKKAEVPIIVAINKIDKIEGSAPLQTVKRQLAEHDVVVEDWGGDVICVPISAKTGQGIEELLEMIVLQSQLMDLKADLNLPAKAFVLESELEKGHGLVATVVCLEGTIKQSDYFICGSVTGRVRLLINSFGEKIAQAGTSIPVKVVGFDSFVGIGDWLTVIPRQEYLRIKSRGGLFIGKEPVFLEEGELEQIKLVIRTDTNGTKEAVEGSISKICKKIKKGERGFKLISNSLGTISESDIELANTTGSIILGMHVKAEKNAVLLAKSKGVVIKSFDIIYKMVEYLEDLLKKTKKIEVVWKNVGKAVVKKVFRIKKIGIVAGCDVKEGLCSRNNKVICLRNGEKIGEGKIISLQREGKTVKEVHAGYECGFVCDKFDGWQENDVVECFVQEKES
ncbi:translation initiation factor IF-2 [Candidatus Babeliales bacterium]|nr:translation initiation factor IF-2 [Candidatus Babeliales bacterium]